jgi:hypothetical protein
MDYELLVDERIEDGRSLLAGLAEDGFDVTVAFWAKTSEEGHWSLYVGSTAVRTMSVGDAYLALYGALRRIPNPRITLTDIKIVDPDSPIARAAIEVRDRFPARLPTRYKGERLGDLAIEEAYVYPRTGVMTRSEVLQTVTGLMDRTGAVAPSWVTLRDGTQFQAVPVAIQGNIPGAIQVVFHDLVASTNRAIPVDDVVGIR